MLLNTLAVNSIYEDVLTSLKQVSTLTNFATNIDLTSQPLENIHHFLNLLHEFVERIILLYVDLGNLKIFS